MHVERLPLGGAMLLSLPAFCDTRGYFKEAYSSARYRAAGITDDFVQDNVSYSHRNVVRGLHGDPRMSKLVGVLAGEAYDVIVDVRPGSPTRGRWHAVTLRAGEHRQIFVPAGFLHGFLALSEDVALPLQTKRALRPVGRIRRSLGRSGPGHRVAAGDRRRRFIAEGCGQSHCPVARPDRLSSRRA